MGSFFREPLVYFLLLGGSLFLLSEWQSGNSAGEASPTEIVITQGRLDALSAGFQKVWQRLPTDNELEALVDDFIREEILYREALGMGLDRDDPIVRRRMRQKVEFLGQDLANTESADDTTLQKFLDENTESYREPDQFSFAQVYLNPQLHGDAFNDVVEQTLSKLKDPATDPAEMGDRLLIEHRYYKKSSLDIQRVFGTGFARDLASLVTGGWTGPIHSGYGQHLVFISEHIPGRIPPLSAVRAQVLRDWSQMQRKQANEQFYQALRARYKVVESNAPAQQIASEQ